jgi:hypothetical protein
MAKIDLRDLKTIIKFLNDKKKKKRKRKRKATGSVLKKEINTIDPSLFNSSINPVLNLNNQLGLKLLEQNLSPNENIKLINNLVENKINPTLSKIMDTQTLLYNGIGNLYNKMDNNDKNVIIEEINNDDTSYPMKEDTGLMESSYKYMNNETMYTSSTPQEMTYSKIYPTTDYVSPTVSINNSPNPYINYDEQEIFENNPMNENAFKTPMPKINKF